MKGCMTGNYSIIFTLKTHYGYSLDISLEGNKSMRRNSLFPSSKMKEKGNFRSRKGTCICACNESILTSD